MLERARRLRGLVALLAAGATGCGARSGLPVEGSAPGASLDGLRWELPCRDPHSGTACACDNQRTVSITFSGVAGKLYQATLRFRGVVETKQYDGGTSDGAFFQIGGSPVTDNWNVYRLEVASPAETYFLNRGASGLGRVFAVDYEAVVPIRGGSALTLDSQGFDGHEIVNTDGQGNPIVVPDIPPAPAAYDGQFIQVDVVATQ